MLKKSCVRRINRHSTPIAGIVSFSLTFCYFDRFFQSSWELLKTRDNYTWLIRGLIIDVLINWKDNLNVFLRTCQEHFHLNQADLFDITDLEDLNRRRGDDLVAPSICYNTDYTKESSDLSSEKLK